MLVINASNHSGDPEGNSDYLLPEVTERCYQVNVIYKISLI